MDYEKAYNEALQLARSYYDKGTNEFLDTIFPELAESEDEKIRKWLIKEMRCFHDCAIKEMCQEDIDKTEAALAWLEKQKEPKPGTTKDNPIDPFDTKLFQDGVKEGRRLEREDMLKGKQPDGKAMLHVAEKSYQIGLRDGKMEQNAEPFSCGHENGNSEKPNNQWSEEDEGMLNCIIATLCEESHGGRETNEKMVNWLKNRLKSLRSRPKVPDNWKPSEEQMEALDNARFCKSYDRSELDLLYEQLEKRI